MKTILLVDDTDSCRITSKWFLNSLGYAVESARDAEEALQIFDPKLHDLVITDNLMPRMSGVELAHIIKLRAPNTPVVMCTGTPPAGPLDCVDLVLERPLHVVALKEAIDRILGEPGIPPDPSRAGQNPRNEVTNRAADVSTSSPWQPPEKQAGP